MGSTPSSARVWSVKSRHPLTRLPTSCPTITAVGTGLAGLRRHASVPRLSRLVMVADTAAGIDKAIQTLNIAKKVFVIVMGLFGLSFFARTTTNGIIAQYEYACGRVCNCHLSKARIRIFKEIVVTASNGSS